MTPREKHSAIKAYEKRKKVEAEEYQIKFKNLSDLMITSAWLTARLYRAKKIPDLDEILKKEKNQKEMTDEQMLAKVKMLNQMFGGEVR